MRRRGHVSPSALHGSPIGRGIRRVFEGSVEAPVLSIVAALRICEGLIVFIHLPVPLQDKSPLLCLQGSHDVSARLERGRVFSLIVGLGLVSSLLLKNQASVGIQCVLPLLYGQPLVMSTEQLAAETQLVVLVLVDVGTFLYAFIVLHLFLYVSLLLRLPTKEVLLGQPTVFGGLRQLVLAGLLRGGQLADTSNLVCHRSRFIVLPICLFLGCLPILLLPHLCEEKLFLVLHRLPPALCQGRVLAVEDPHA
mmetsp:Transcript_60790/g.131875  ORF Transcript_60790/g.131875 Transcript_60790/m.131875 type:complete len:251 (+) Transcript_60790:236-988(+)